MRSCCEKRLNAKTKRLRKKQGELLKRLRGKKKLKSRVINGLENTLVREHILTLRGKKKLKSRVITELKTRVE